MSDDNSEFVTNASQIETVALASLRKEPHVLEDLPKTNGKTAKVMACALTVGEYEDYKEFAAENPKDSEIALFWWGARAPDRSQIWKSPEDACKQIRSWPLSVKQGLTDKINEVNGPKSVKEAEGNSEGDQTGSPSSSSASDSASGTSNG